MTTKSKRQRAGKVKVGKVTAQGYTLPTRADIKAEKIAPRGRNRGRGR